MNIGTRTVVVIAALVALSGTAVRAEEPSWSYLEAGYLNVDPDALSGSGDNWFAGGSFEFLQHLHVLARYLDGDYAAGVDQSYWKVGVGWHGLLGEKVDAVGELHWVDTEVANVGDDGYQLTGGVRWRMVKFIELDGFFNYTDLDASGSQESLEGRILFDIWRLSFGAAYETSDDYDQYNAFVRFNFDRK